MALLLAAAGVPGCVQMGDSVEEDSVGMNGGFEQAG
jgi:hypothetical protein